MRREPILIIDDDDEIRHLARRILEHDGWTCQEASGRAEALESIACEPPCLIVLDWQLGDDRTQPNFLTELERRYPTVPVVVVSGHLPDPNAMCTRNFAGWRTKPFARAELMQTVRAALGG